MTEGTAMAEGSGLFDLARISANYTAPVAAGLVIPAAAQSLMTPPELATSQLQPHAHSESESTPTIQLFQNLQSGPASAESSMAKTDAGLGWKVLDSEAESGDLEILAAEFNGTRPLTGSESGQNVHKQYAGIFDDGSEDGSSSIG